MAETDHDLIVLVDDADQQIGVLDKMEAHQRGALHRAFSVLVSDSEGRLLIHKRAAGKYHSEGLWSNTCCGHPRPDEQVAVAARRRLAEEMGFDCPLSPLFKTTYRADVSNGLIEHELVHVFSGRFHGSPRPNPGEVEAWRWETLPAIAAEIAEHPERYTVWFRRYITEFGTALAPRG